MGTAVGSYERPIERGGGDAPLPLGGTLLNEQLEIGMSPFGMSPVSGIGSERAKIASVCQRGAPGTGRGNVSGHRHYRRP